MLSQENRRQSRPHHWPGGKGKDMVFRIDVTACDSFRIEPST